MRSTRVSALAGIPQEAIRQTRGFIGDTYKKKSAGDRRVVSPYDAAHSVVRCLSRSGRVDRRLVCCRLRQSILRAPRPSLGGPLGIQADGIISLHFELELYYKLSQSFEVQHYLNLQIDRAGRRPSVRGRGRHRISVFFSIVGHSCRKSMCAQAPT